MTWPYDMQFEVRTTGHDDNGGGFSRTGSGTDYSNKRLLHSIKQILKFMPQTTAR